MQAEGITHPATDIDIVEVDGFGGVGGDVKSESGQ